MLKRKANKNLFSPPIVLYKDKARGRTTFLSGELMFEQKDTPAKQIFIIAHRSPPNKCYVEKFPAKLVCLANLLVICAQEVRQ